MIQRPTMIRRFGATLTRAGTAMAVASLAVTVSNAALIRRPTLLMQPSPEPLRILLPVRNEAHNIDGCLSALRAAADRWPGPVRIVVLDDESSDGTAALIAAIAAVDDRIDLRRGTPTPDGWLGKTWACAQLARAALDDDTAGDSDPGLLVFVDADVRVAPEAFTASAGLLRDVGLDLLCPFPRQRATSAVERLIQPLLQWSWMSTLPLRIAERSPRPSMSAANGQLLMVDAAAYLRAGGHAAVRGEVIEDIALLRALKTSGGRGVVAEGSRVAQCHMYDGARELRDGYRKSLWAAFGSTAGAVATVSALNVAYVVPPAAALTGSRTGLLGYTAAVTSRAVVARSTGGRVWPDVLTHPIAITGFTALTADSLVARRRGALSWKGRSVGVRR